MTTSVRQLAERRRPGGPALDQVQKFRIAGLVRDGAYVELGR